MSGLQEARCQTPLNLLYLRVLFRKWPDSPSPSRDCASDGCLSIAASSLSIMPSLEAAIAADVMSTAAAPPVFAAGLISSHLIQGDKSSSRHCGNRPCSKVFGQSLSTTAHELHCLAAKLSKQRSKQIPKKRENTPNGIYKVQLCISHGHPRDAISDLPRFHQLCRLTKYYKISGYNCMVCCRCSSSNYEADCEAQVPRDCM